MNNYITIHDLGLVEYEDALEFQLKLFNEIVSTKISNRRNNTKIKTKNHLVFVEHNSVYTLGKSGEILLPVNSKTGVETILPLSDFLAFCI